jgi:hypothetical protein
MLDLSRPRQRWFIFLCALMIAGTVIQMADKFLENRIWGVAGVVQQLPLLFFALFLFKLHGRAEFRVGGITSNGRFIRWRNVKSHAWRPPIGGFEVLQVWPKGLGRFLPERLLVRPEIKQQVNELLESQLSPWLG